MDDVFRPLDGGTVSLAVSNATARVQLSAVNGRREVRVYNATTVDVFVRFGGPTVTAATTDLPIPAGAVEMFSIADNDNTARYIAAITASGSGTIYATSGYGF